MQNKYKVPIIMAVVALPFAAFFSSVSAAPSDDQQTILSRVAEILGVNQTEITSAFKTAQIESIDEKVASGDMDSEKAEEMKTKINESEGLIFMRGPKGDKMHKGDTKENLGEFLGMTEDQLDEAKQNGTSIEELLEQNDKSHADFAEFNYQKHVAEVNAKVASGDLDQSEADEILQKMSERHQDRLEKIESGELTLEDGKGSRGFGKGL